MDPTRSNTQTQDPHPLHFKRNESFWISIAALLTPYVGIALVIAFAEFYAHWFFKLLALVLIAALQNHLQILLHEGAHYQIYPNKRLNDFLTNLFCAVPFFGFVSHYRHFHLAHHQHLLNPQKDPEVEFYSEQGHFFKKKPLRSLLKTFCLDFCGYHYFQFFFSYNRYLYQETQANRMPRLKQSEVISVVLVTMGALTLCQFPNGIFNIFFYWILPQPTFLFFFLKLQGYGEHSARSEQMNDCTHTHDLSWITRFFIYPFNSDLHLEHHLYPSVPWYQLRKVHLHLAQTGSVISLGQRFYFWGRHSIFRKILLKTKEST